MKINTLINELYGNIDQMIRDTNTNLSRSYIYQICSGEKCNVSIEVAKELIRILKLRSIDDLLPLLDDAKKVQ